MKKALIKTGQAIVSAEEPVDTFDPSQNEFIRLIVDREFHDLTLDLSERIDAFLG